MTGGGGGDNGICRGHFALEIIPFILEATASQEQVAARGVVQYAPPGLYPHLVPYPVIAPTSSSPPSSLPTSSDPNYHTLTPAPSPQFQTLTSATSPTPQFQTLTSSSSTALAPQFQTLTSISHVPQFQTLTSSSSTSPAPQFQTLTSSSSATSPAPQFQTLTSSPDQIPLPHSPIFYYDDHHPAHHLKQRQQQEELVPATLGHQTMPHPAPLTADNASAAASSGCAAGQSVSPNAAAAVSGSDAMLTPLLAPNYAREDLMGPLYNSGGENDKRYAAAGVTDSGEREEAITDIVSAALSTTFLNTDAGT